MEPYQNQRKVVQNKINRNSSNYFIGDEGKGFEHSKIPVPTNPQNLFKL